MDPEIAKLLTVVLTDVIKIVGPVAVTGWVTWKIAKGQFAQKLKELESNHEFLAREHLFQYYKDREKQLVETFRELNSGLGKIIGFTSILEQEKMLPELNALYDWLGIYMHMIPTMLSLTMTDMEQEGLSKTPEYEQLKKCESDLHAIKIDRNFENLKASTFSIFDIYLNLLRGNSLLLKKFREKVFTKYILE